jgi:hypothetical protein
VPRDPEVLAVTAHPGRTSGTPPTSTLRTDGSLPSADAAAPPDVTARCGICSVAHYFSSRKMRPDLISPACSRPSNNCSLTR